MAKPDVPRPKVAKPQVPAKPAPTPPVDAAKHAAASPEADSLKLQMPAGELGVRNQPVEVSSIASGGTSKAEDTTRTAGYVVDLTKTNEPPPGPPIAKDPANFAGPEKAAPPPKQSKPTPDAPAKGPPKPPTPDPTGTGPNPRPGPKGDRRPPPTPANPIPKPWPDPDNPADPARNPAQVSPAKKRPN